MHGSNISSNSLTHILSLTHTAVVIGFRQTAVSVNENDGIATLVVAVLRGTLAKPIMVVFSTNDLTATGEC